MLYGIRDLASVIPQKCPQYRGGPSCDMTFIKYIKTLQLQGERVRLKPMMKLIGNMHGNEAVGREMLLALSAYLLENFNTSQRVGEIVRNTDIHIMPSLNPDGRIYVESSTRGPRF